MVSIIFKRTFILSTIALMQLLTVKSQLVIDPIFNAQTTYTTLFRSINLQTDDKMILNGNFHVFTGSPRTYLTRLLPNGQTDNTFNADSVLFAPVNCSELQSDGKLIVGGFFNSIYYAAPNCSRNFLARLNSNGSLDTSFNTLNGFDNVVTAIAIQTDGKIIVTGWFTKFNGVVCNNVVRLNTNGSIDNSFFVNSILLNGDIFKIIIQHDGKILLANNNSQYSKIIRLNSNGSIDNTFSVGVGFKQTTNYTEGLNNLLLQPDGKIVCIGSFSNANSTLVNNIIRLNTNGSTDNTFTSGSGFNSYASHIVIQSDGKLIISGDFTSYNGTAASHIVRLNANGTIDNTFNTGLGLSNSALLMLQANGDILCAMGTSVTTTYNGLVCNNIIRLINNLTTNLREETSSSNFNLYPNPAKEQVTIESDELANNEEIEISIIDDFGRTIKQSQEKVCNRKVILTTNFLTNGLYIILLKINPNSSKPVVLKKYLVINNG